MTVSTQVKRLASELRLGVGDDHATNEPDLPNRSGGCPRCIQDYLICEGIGVQNPFMWGNGCGIISSALEQRICRPNADTKKANSESADDYHRQTGGAANMS